MKLLLLLLFGSFDFLNSTRSTLNIPRLNHDLSFTHEPRFIGGETENYHMCAYAELLTDFKKCRKANSRFFHQHKKQRSMNDDDDMHYFILECTALHSNFGKLLDFTWKGYQANNNHNATIMIWLSIRLKEKKEYVH